MKPRLFLLELLALLASSASCRRPDPAKLVVGIQSDPMGGIVSALHVVVRVGGKVVDDELLAPPRGSRVGFPQPWEKTFVGAGKAGAPVEVSVDALGDQGDKPLFTRLASTHFVSGATALLRVPLEARCIVYPQVPRGTSRVPGPLSGPTCAAPATCILGACMPSDVPPSGLEPYAPGWPAKAPDRCKPRGAGAPDLQVGTGQSSFLPVTPGQVLQAEAGPQGGHHLWIAARIRNIKQAGSLTKIEGVQPDTKVAIPPTNLAFTYGPDEGGYCKLVGIRYQLDNEGIDYKQFLGKPLDVTVTVTDASGSRASATAHVQVAPTILNP